jgi:hypothetical protein
MQPVATQFDGGASPIDLYRCPEHGPYHIGGATSLTSGEPECASGAGIVAGNARAARLILIGTGPGTPRRQKVAQLVDIRRLDQMMTKTGGV